MLRRLTGVFALVTPLACAPAATVPQSKHTAQHAEIAQRTAPLESEPQDESSFAQKAGATHRIKLPDALASVTGRLTTPNATYLRIRANPGAKLETAVLQSVSDSSGHPLVAVASSSSASLAQLQGAEPYEMLIRLGKSKPKDGLTKVHWTARRLTSSNAVIGGYEQTLSIPPFDSAPIQSDLERSFGETMARWFGQRSEGDPFMSFAEARLLHRFVKTPAKKGTFDPAPQRRELTELSRLMDFYTGRSSVRDSLQTDRGHLQAYKPGPLTVRPETIQIDAPIDRDYEQLVKKATPGNAPVLSPVAQALPADALVIEFTTLKDLIQLPRILDDRLGSVLRVAEGVGGSNHLVERYRKQLGIELDGLAESLGKVAVKSVAVVLGDPYLREGTDLSLVFRAENSTLLESVLAAHLARAKTRLPNVVTTRESIAGESVTVSTSPDGAFSRYEYVYSDLRILSNSRAGITRFIETKRGKQSKLSDDKGYLGARRLAPYDAAQEKAFVFFGDEFVANVVGPRARILESRRMRAQSELEAVDNLALLYGWLEGTPASTKAELLDSGWAEKADFVHSDGSTIEWTSAAGAHSHWGYAKALVPIADLPFDKISPDEASAYRSFRSWYNAALSGRLDPTSLRVLRGPKDDGITTELRVFPIMPNGTFQREFREIANMVGAGRVEPGAKLRGATVTLGVGEGSPLRDLSDNFIHQLLSNRKLSVSFVGDWVQAGWDGDSVIWDVANSERSIANISESDIDRSRIDLDQSLPKLTVWAAMHIKSRLLLAAALTVIRAEAEKAAEGLVKWSKDGDYREIPVTRIQAKESDSSDAIRINIYYAVAKDVLLVSLRREVLQARIDDVLDNRTPKGSRLPQTPTQFVIDLAPRAGGWQRRTAQGWLDAAAGLAHERACTGLEVLSRGLGPLPQDASARRQLALRFLGFEPESPQSGTLAWHDGLCEHPVYGTAVDPKVPDAKDPNVPLHRTLDAVGALRFVLGIVPRGDAAELWSRFELDPASQPAVK